MSTAGICAAGCRSCLDQIVAAVAEHGIAAATFTGGDGRPLAYTIGMTARGMPELLIRASDPYTSGDVLVEILSDATQALTTGAAVVGGLIPIDLPEPGAVCEPGCDHEEAGCAVVTLTTLIPCPLWLSAWARYPHLLYPGRVVVCELHAASLN